MCLILLHRIFKTKMSKRGTLFDFAFTSGSAKKKPRINEDSQNEVGQPPELQNTQEVVVEVHRDPIVEHLEVVEDSRPSPTGGGGIELLDYWAVDGGLSHGCGALNVRIFNEGPMDWGTWIEAFHGGA